MKTNLIQMRRKFTILFFFIPSCIQTHGQDSLTLQKEGIPELTRAGASVFAKLPMRCMEKEWPYKTGIVFTDSVLLEAPRNYHPAFFGCFDWHSSVHGHWMLVRLMKRFPGLKEETRIREIFNRHFTKENIQTELKIFNSKDNKGFERTYGWAWLLQLQDELLGWDDMDAHRWAEAIQPMADKLSALTIEFLSKLVYPIRVGEHPNLAFGLSMMVDYALHQQDEKLMNAIKKAGLRFFIKDKNCPFSWEPGGNDFLSPCLEEADLMRKILPLKEFSSWFHGFLPQLLDNQFNMEPGKVIDRTDGKLVHLDGLNLSRAWCLNGIAKTLKNRHIRDLAIQHLNAALPHVASGDYAGEHWLASFAVYAMTSR